MTAKEHLQQYAILEEKRKQLAFEIIEVREGMAGVGSPALSDRVQTSPSGDQMGNRVAKLISMEERLQALIDEKLAMGEKIITEIHNVDNAAYIKILYKRYIEFKKLKEIADEMDYSLDRVKHMHGYALQEFAYANHLKDDTQ